MRQPCMKFPGASPRAAAGADVPAFAAHGPWTPWMLAGITVLAGSLLPVCVAHLTPRLRPASSRTTSTPTSVPFAATDAHLLHLSLLILTFIEGAFSWVIVISTGQSAEAAPHVPDMDRRHHRPPRATWGSLERRVAHQNSHLRRPQTLRLALRRPHEFLPCAGCDVVRHQPQVQLTGGRAPRPSAAARTGPAGRRVEGRCSATFPIRISVGAKGAAPGFAAR